MKIDLIEPSPPGFNVFSHFVMPRLGLPLIGTILKAKGHLVKIYNQALNQLDHKKIEQSDLIGLSTTTSTAPSAYRLADRYRRVGKPVVMGGPHVTFMADEALDHADYVVRGEGEDTITELVSAIESGRPKSGIDGLSYVENGVKKHNPDRALQSDLNKLPMPDFTLLDNYQKLQYTPIATSRGCPFDCSFCSVTSMFGRCYRQREVDLIMEEINRFPRRHIFFYDDNFVVNTDYTKELLGKMNTRRQHTPWSAQTRVDVYRDQELLKLMRKTNCETLYIGFESVDPGTLRAYNKKQSLTQMRECVRTLHQNRIKIHGMFVFGSDNDDEGVIENTIKFVHEEKIDTVQYLILTPLPGSQTFTDLESQNRILNHNWDLYDAHHVVFQPLRMTGYELQLQTIRAMRKFYSRLQGTKEAFLGKYYQAGRKLMGNGIIRRWEKINREFIQSLRKLPKL